MVSATTSIRLRPELRQKLDRAARRTGLGRNTLVVQALRKFLDPDFQESLAEEARRQSLAATRHEPDWERVAEIDPWPSPSKRNRK
jgi:predicted transcriptional regulator